jgi:hypothetical protein
MKIDPIPRPKTNPYAANLVVRPPPRLLVFDEIETFCVRGKDANVRIRIWMCKDHASVVLVTQLPGQPSPRPIGTWLANYINQVYLHCNDHNLIYFDDCESLTEEGVSHTLQQHVFNTYGTPLRQTMYSPRLYEWDWDFFRQILSSSPIER